MRRWLGFGLSVILVGMAYWAWPLVGAAQLAALARSGDAAGVIDRVDIDALRRSLSRQIAGAYLDVSGKGKSMGAIGRSLAGAAITTVADPYVAQLLTPANITALLAQGRVGQVQLGDRNVDVKGILPNFAAGFGDHILAAVTGSYFDRIKDFVIPIDGGHGDGDRYGLHMHLVGLTWKLGGLDLPRPMIEEMARSIMAGEKAAAL